MVMMCYNAVNPNKRNKLKRKQTAITGSFFDSKNGVGFDDCRFNVLKNISVF